MMGVCWRIVDEKRMAAYHLAFALAPVALGQACEHSH